MKNRLFRSWVVNPKSSHILPVGESWESLEEYVLSEIGKGRGDEDQLLPKICERTGWSWEQSQHYLREVERKDQFRIRQDQTRLFLIGASVLGLVGAGFMVLAYEFIRGSGNYSQCAFLEYTPAWKQILGEQGLTPCLAWNSTMFVNPLLLAGIGILMVAGSLLGALQAIRNSQ